MNKQNLEINQHSVNKNSEGANQKKLETFYFVEQSEAVSLLFDKKHPKRKPVTVIATKKLRDNFDNTCIEQALNASQAPGVQQLILNPDAHGGYGAPIGSVLVSDSHIYPGPVGVDIKCSMSLLQLDLPEKELENNSLCRELINLISMELPSMIKGTQKSPATLKRNITTDLAKQIVTEGATEEICNKLGIPFDWTLRCEDSVHKGHDKTAESLKSRLEYLLTPVGKSKADKSKKVNQKARGGGEKIHFERKMGQFATYGSGNHFGEANIVHVADNPLAQMTANIFKLIDGCVSVLSHCGSRGFGYELAQNQFKTLLEKFNTWSIPLPGDDKQMVYAPLHTLEANAYLDDMALGANFSTMNHLLINSVLLECFQKVIPGVKGHLVYYISHNIAREEVINNKLVWVHRKGATRAWPAGHHGLKDTPFYDTGHPILLPGDPLSGSKVMVAKEGAKLSCYSINHGAGRAMGRNEAKRQLEQKDVDSSFKESNVLTNRRQYPVDEAPAAYKDFKEVTDTVEKAGLATTVADLKARFVIKGS